jgi:hypothetical protein
MVTKAEIAMIAIENWSKRWRVKCGRMILSPSLGWERPECCASNHSLRGDGKGKRAKGKRAESCVKDFDIGFAEVSRYSPIPCHSTHPRQIYCHDATK